jgi:hypothetical protein
MSTEHRSLLMNANRRLGAALVDHNLVKIEDLETANERLLEIVATNQPRQSTVLGILAFEMKVVREDDVLTHLVETESIGLVDLREYEVSEDLKKTMDRGAAWATWSVPFDQEEDFTFIATAYYLSAAVRNYWEKQFAGPVLWFGTTLEGIADFLERIDGESSNSRSPFASKTPPIPPTKSTSKPFPKPLEKAS